MLSNFYDTWYRQIFLVTEFQYDIQKMNEKLK